MPTTPHQALLPLWFDLLQRIRHSCQNPEKLEMFLLKKKELCFMYLCCSLQPKTDNCLQYNRFQNIQSKQCNHLISVIIDLITTQLDYYKVLHLGLPVETTLKLANTCVKCRGKFIGRTLCPIHNYTYSNIAALVVRRLGGWGPIQSLAIAFKPLNIQH